VNKAGGTGVDDGWMSVINYLLQKWAIYLAKVGLQ
jgi:hypothetical protein